MLPKRSNGKMTSSTSKMIAPVRDELVEWTRISKFPVGSDEDATEPSEPEQRSPGGEKELALTLSFRQRATSRACQNRASSNV